MSLVSYVAFFYGWASLGILLASVLMNPKGVLNRAVALASILNAVWNFSMVFVAGADDPATILFFYHLSYLGALFVIPAMLNIYLALVELPTRLRWTLIAADALFSLFLYFAYETWGYYYEDFQPGPWGNVGVHTREVFWPSVTPYVHLALELMVGAVLLQARFRTDSQRLKKQVTVAALSIPVTYALYFVTWEAEQTWPLPPLQFLAGASVMAFTLYLIWQYGYLRRDDHFLVRRLGSAVPVEVLMVDRQRRITGANPAALGRLAPLVPGLIGSDLTSLADDPATLVWAWSRIWGGRRVISCLIGQMATSVTLTPRHDEFGDWLGASVLLTPLGSLDARVKEQRLSARQTQIVLLMVQGYQGQEIGTILGISFGTVKRHTHDILGKTSSASRTELLAKLLK